MSGTLIAFLIWSLICVLLAACGIYAFFSKKTVGFWANIKPIQVTDVSKYNRATGRLLFAFGVCLFPLGLPLLTGQNSPWIILSVLGTMIEVIVVMAVYTLAIEAKYQKK